MQSLQINWRCVAWALQGRVATDTWLHRYTTKKGRLGAKPAEQYQTLSTLGGADMLEAIGPTRGRMRRPQRTSTRCARPSGGSICATASGSITRPAIPRSRLAKTLSSAT